MHNKNSTNTPKSQAGDVIKAEDVINKIKEDREKLDRIETVEEAKAIAESEEKIIEQAEAYIRDIDEKLSIAVENFEFAYTKQKELEDKVAIVHEALTKAKASSEALTKRIDTLEKRIDEIVSKLAYIETLVYITLGASIITGVLVWLLSK